MELCIVGVFEALGILLALGVLVALVLVKSNERSYNLRFVR